MHTNVGEMSGRQVPSSLRQKTAMHLISHALLFGGPFMEGFTIKPVDHTHALDPK